jgi:hypothetical protein
MDAERTGFWKKKTRLVWGRKVCYFGIVDLSENDSINQNTDHTLRKGEDNVRRNKEKRVEETDIQTGNREAS